MTVPGGGRPRLVVGTRITSTPELQQLRSILLATAAVTLREISSICASYAVGREVKQM